LVEPKRARPDQAMVLANTPAEAAPIRQHLDRLVRKHASFPA